MRKTLQITDFSKVEDFIINNTRLDKNSERMVREISSVNLFIGPCHITKSDSDWVVTVRSDEKIFSTKRNAMYYSFLTTYKNTDLIPSLISIDNRLAITQSDIIRYKYMLGHDDIRNDSFRIGLYHIKLSEAVARYQQAKTEMYDWMNRAKYIHN